MKNLIFLTLFLLVLPQILKAQIANGGAFSMEQSVIATGGNVSSNGVFTLSGTTGQNAVGTVTATSTFNQVGGFWTFDQLQTNAATVSIGGKVRTKDGSGIRNVIITLTDLNGSIRTTTTGTFGAYRYIEVQAGQTYVLNISAKKYIFVNYTQIISVNDELLDLDFIGQEK